MDEVYEEELSRARVALTTGKFEVCFAHLERAHVLSQRMTLRHTHVHWLMLAAGWRRRDGREVFGQLPRMLASALFSRLCVPRGNSGRARVSAFAPMPVQSVVHHFRDELSHDRQGGRLGPAGKRDDPETRGRAHGGLEHQFH